MPASRPWSFVVAATTSLFASAALAGIEISPPQKQPPAPGDIRFSSTGPVADLKFQGLSIPLMLGLGEPQDAAFRNADYVLRASIAGTRDERRKTEKQCSSRTGFEATHEGFGCAFETLQELMKKQVTPSEARKRTKSGKALVRKLRNQADWDAAANLSYRQAMTLVNPKKLEEAKRLVPFATSAGCKTPLLSAALFNQSEEFLPDPEAFRVLEAVYATIANCLDVKDPVHEQVHMRMGLLDVLKRDLKGAKEAFNRALQNQVPSEEFRTLFWRGLLENDPVMSASPVALKWNNYWARLVADYPLTQHSMLLQGIFGEHPLENAKQDGVGVVPFAGGAWDVQNLSNLIFLSALAKSDKRVASEFSARIAGKISPATIGPGMFLAVAHREAGNLRESMRVTYAFAKAAGVDALHPEIIRLLYPVMYEKQVARHAGDSLEVPLALSLMRQESSFNPKAKSPVGAVGLMQVLPRTAKIRSPRELSEPDTNIAAGCKYLRSQLRQFDGNEVLTLAAYNAGPTVVRRWLKRYDGASPLLYADLIPYSETRSYVSGVLRGRFWYRHLLSNLDEKTQVKNELLYGSHLLDLQLLPDISSKKASTSLLSFLARKPIPEEEKPEPLYVEEL